ncbi:MAG: tyrosine-type recombinase/integrase [Pseudobdellovibrio sp.]
MSFLTHSLHFNRHPQTAQKKLPQLPFIKFHGLRHSFCSYLDSTGMSRRIVSEIMGHRDLNTTNRYSHVNNKMLGYEVSRWLNSQSKQNSNNFEAINF